MSQGWADGQQNKAIYLATPGTLTDTQESPFTCDSTRQLRVAASITVPAGTVILVADATLGTCTYQQITSLNTSQALTVPAGATIALFQAESQAIRWRPDGASTAPTASVGMRLLPNQMQVYSGSLANIRFIEETASAKLNVSYFSVP